MSLFHVLGFGLKVGHLLWLLCCSLVSLLSSNWMVGGGGGGGVMDTNGNFLGDGGKVSLDWLEKFLGHVYKIHQSYYPSAGSKKVGKTWWRKLLLAWIVVWSVISSWVFWGMSSLASEERKETLVSMCDERARMLQDPFNVSMNHVQAMSILIATFHHGKYPSTIDQATSARYTERTAFERPLTSGIAYAMRVLQFEREEFEKQQGWKIKRMDAHVQKPVHKDDYEAEVYKPSLFKMNMLRSSLRMIQFHTLFLLTCCQERKTMRIYFVQELWEKAFLLLHSDCSKQSRSNIDIRCLAKGSSAKCYSRREN